jgi:hypothetical protein
MSGVAARPARLFQTHLALYFAYAHLRTTAAIFAAFDELDPACRKPVFDKMNDNLGGVRRVEDPEVVVFDLKAGCGMT